MRTTASLLLLALASAAVANEPGAAVGGKGNTFLTSNPGYRERAGAFYEKDYLPHAVAEMVRAVGVKGLTEEHARAVLKGFIYDWLAEYIAHNGTMPEAALAVVKAKLDRDVQKILANDAAALARYHAWRDGGQHSLSFLMVPHPR